MEKNKLGSRFKKVVKNTRFLENILQKIKNKESRITKWTVNKQKLIILKFLINYEGSFNVEAK